MTAPAAVPQPGDHHAQLRRSVLEAYRWCLGCKLEHPESAFVGERGQKVNRCAMCRAKLRARPRPVHDPAATRRAYLRQKYGITVEEYDALREAQSHQCAICGTHEDDIQVPRVGRPRKDGTPAAEAAKLVVDHCHASGRVRGLLCNGCNSAIGHFRDSTEVMRAAIRYLSPEA
ncbi:endonuclease VII domain-containing protein [Micromonospora taraxaci]|uniref:endonuclease VII domain-containing protein n=1 Tax=Micromonospora taraxaci TaxID=1316803 RepID=UPI003C30DDC3